MGARALFYGTLESGIVNAQTVAREDDKEAGLTLAQLLLQKLFGNEGFGTFILEAAGLQPVDRAGAEDNRQEENHDAGGDYPHSVAIAVFA